MKCKDEINEVNLSRESLPHLRRGDFAAAAAAALEAPLEDILARVPRGVRGGMEDEECACGCQQRLIVALFRDSNPVAAATAAAAAVVAVIITTVTQFSGSKESMKSFSRCTEESSQ